MRVQLLLVLILCSSATPSMAADCPWKLRELEERLGQSAARIANARSIAGSKDQEIGGLRHATVLGCDSEVEARLDNFEPAIRGLDIRAELRNAEIMTRCIDIKRVQAKERIERARGESNRMLEQRLLTVSAEIERLAPKVLDYDVRTHQLVSKLERLAAERKRLLDACAMGDM